MNTSKPAHRKSLPPAISRAGPIRIRVSISGSSIGWWRSAKVRQRRRFSDVPFFWSQHYDVPINYVGHAEKWDELQTEGSIAARDCLVRYRQNGKTLALASIFRDLQPLKDTLALDPAPLANRHPDHV